MLQVIFDTVVSKFSFNGVAGASHTGSVGTSALDHEAFDDPVEDQPVVKALIDQTDKVIYGNRSNVRVKLCFHDVAIFHCDRYDWILCHDYLPPNINFESYGFFPYCI